VTVCIFDTETELMSPGRMAPPLVCVSYQRPGFPADIVHAGGVDDRGALELVTNWLEHHETLVGHHVVYDFGVLGAKWPHLIPAIFAKYDRDEVTDTKLRQQLLDIAAGCFRGKLCRFSKEVTKADGSVETVEGARWIQYNYGLDDLARRGLGRQLEKDEWRLRYGEFKSVPLTQWPDGARKYPLEDAKATLEIFQLQEEHAEFMEDQFRQARAAWALHLTQTWGLKTHGPSVEKLERETLTALGAIEDGLKECGFVRENGVRDTRKTQAHMVAVCKAAGKPVRLTETGEKKFKEITETGQIVVKKGGKEVIVPVSAEGVYEYIASAGGISLDNDACAASEDDLLEDYAERTSLEAMKNKDIPFLKAGIEYPVHTSYGMAASGRSTSSKPNVQNPKRSGDVYRNCVLKYSLPDVRECWMPREGMVFAQADFEQLELCTLGQTCITLFGHSTLGDAINAGIDPHTDFACSILGIPYEVGIKRKKDKSDKEFDNARQTAKVANFGYPGGLGANTLCLFARKSYNVSLTPEKAKALKEQWIAHWPEMQEFFAYVGGLIDKDTGDGVLQQLFSNRWRGGCHYTAACNSFFQGLGADAAKRALYLVCRACYAEPESVLYGSRPVLFVHDELVAEVLNDEHAHDKAVEMARVMIAGANEFLPDVPAKTEPILATRWSKKMQPIFDANKRLRVWSPEIMQEWKRGNEVLYDGKGRQMIPEPEAA